MTSYQAHAVQNHYAWRQNVTLSQKTDKLKKLGNVSRGIIAILIILLFGLIYISQATRAGALSKPIADMQGKVEDLKRDNQALSVEVAKMQSLKDVKSSEVATSLAAPSETSFAQ